MNLSDLSLVELRRTKAPKYDVMLKRFFSFRYSSLRSMLRIPDGIRLTEETTGLSGLRMDAVLRAQDTIYHVEFQAQNHPMMHQRMLEYYLSLTADYTDLKTLNGPVVDQYVLYVGSEKIRMKPYIARDRLQFCFKMRSIKAFYHGWRRRLSESPFPEDQILRLLTFPYYDRRIWLNVARRVSILPGERPENSETQALLLIACILRNIPHDDQEEIEKMLTVDVSRSRILAEVFHHGENVKETEVLLRKIDQIVAANGFEFDPVKREDLATTNDVDIEIFFDNFVMAPDKQAFLEDWSIGLRY